MVRRPLPRNARGFTLVELLIVVAIIGVLSTIGVPTFRRMVTKAKKSEAKVSLGGLFTVESAFFTEYNVYGNRLDKVGFDIEGRQRLYHVGFPGSHTCAPQALRPTDTNAQGINLQQLLNDYYTAPNAVTVRARGVTQASSGAGTVGGGGAAGCWVGGNPNPVVEVLADGTTFVASATGNIAPGILPNSTTFGTGGQDAWTIDNQRNLINVADGTN